MARRDSGIQARPRTAGPRTASRARHARWAGLLVLLACVSTGAAAAGAAELETIAVEAAGPPPAQAADASDAATERLIEISCRDDENRPPSWLDRTHSYLTERLCEPAAWFDGFFGDDRALEETPVGTFFRVRNELRWDQEEGFRNRVRLAANVELPRASRRLRLVLTRDEDVNGEFLPYLPENEADGATRVGLRFNLSEHLRSRLDVDATVKAQWDSLNPLLRARYRHVTELSRVTLVRFTQIAFWEGEEGFGTTSRGDWEWLRDVDRQVRVSGQGTWSENSDGLDWRTSIAHFRQLDQISAVRAAVGAFGRTDPDFETEEYFANVSYRRSFIRPWLFYELRPEHAWVIDDESGNRRGDWRFILTFEAQFENQWSREDREARRAARRARRLEKTTGADPAAQPDA